MNRILPYLIGGIGIIALGFLLLSSSTRKERTINEHISLRQGDKIPYGFYVARQLTASLFPAAEFYPGKKSPGYWDSLSTEESNQAVFFVGDLAADEEELENMLAFVKKGNYIFIITKSLSYQATRFFGFNSDDISTDDDFLTNDKDSLQVRLVLPRFNDRVTYVYPGRRYSNYFNYVEPERAIVLGRNGSGHANFLQFKSGRGSIFLHTAPLAFSNYFILHKNNVGYFEQAVSVIPASVKKVVWNEYYLTKKNDKEDEPNWLAVLFQYSAFKWALLTAIFTLLLYVLLEMRRRQRVIPGYARPGNASLDFVQTIGRLYYDQKAHGDLARKMSVYFLEHVRSRYKLPTNELNDDFLSALHYKSGFPQKDLKSMIDFIVFVNGDVAINEHQLTHFHNQLENFYQST